MAATQESVAVLGIGAMGHGMASSALRAGLPTGFGTANRTRLETSLLRGAVVADSAADAARQAGVVVTMVTDAAAVVSIAHDQEMLAALAPGAVWAQMSTIGVAGIERVAAMVEAERDDVLLVDAPCRAARTPPSKARLTIFASGPDDARPACGLSSKRSGSARSGLEQSGPGVGSSW